MYTLGIDIGSTTSKCVILQDGEKLVAKSLQLGGLGTEGPADALTQLWHDSGLHREEMARVIESLLKVFTNLLGMTTMDIS